MKHLLLLAAAVAAIAQTPDAIGWSASKWGMTAQQVQAAFPTARAVNPPQKDQGQLIRLQSAPVQLGIYKASAQFEFQPDADHLTAVAVTVTQDTNRSSKPTSSDSTTEHNAFGNAIVTRTITWRVKSSMINLEWIEAGDVGAVVVRYAERKPDPTL
jgi:hypothetical protein